MIRPTTHIDPWVQVWAKAKGLESVRPFAWLELVTAYGLESVRPFAGLELAAHMVSNTAPMSDSMTHLPPYSCRYVPQLEHWIQELSAW